MTGRVAAGALVIGCGGSISGQTSERASNAGTGGETIEAGVGAGGASGTSSPGGPSGAQSAGGTATAFDAAPLWDGATPVCPVTVAGGVVSGADCYACIPPDAPCDPSLPISPLKTLTAADCAGTFSNNTSFQCEWYPDGVTINNSWGVSITCKSHPGRVICGGGL